MACFEKEGRIALLTRDRQGTAERFLHLTAGGFLHFLCLRVKYSRKNRYTTLFSRAAADIDIAQGICCSRHMDKNIRSGEQNENKKVEGRLPAVFDGR